MYVVSELIVFVSYIVGLLSFGYGCAVGHQLVFLKVLLYVPIEENGTVCKTADWFENAQLPC